MRLAWASPARLWRDFVLAFIAILLYAAGLGPAGSPDGEALFCLAIARSWARRLTFVFFFYFVFAWLSPARRRGV